MLKRNFIIAAIVLCVWAAASCGSLETAKTERFRVVMEGHSSVNLFYLEDKQTSKCYLFLYNASGVEIECTH